MRGAGAADLSLSSAAHYLASSSAILVRHGPWWTAARAPSGGCAMDPRWSLHLGRWFEFLSPLFEFKKFVCFSGERFSSFSVRGCTHGEGQEHRCLGGINEAPEKNRQN